MFARTPRLLLRPGWREDAPALVKAIGDVRVVRNLATAPFPYRIEDAEAFLAREPAGKAMRCLIFRRTDGAPELIGGIGFGPRGPLPAELGYWLAPDHWGRGYATEAGRAVIEIARVAYRLPGLQAGHFVDNPASGRVLEKLGFQPTGAVAGHFSLARGGEAPCREFTLDFAGAEAAIQPGDGGAMMAA